MRTGPLVMAIGLAAFAPLLAAAQSTQPETDAVPVITQPSWETPPRPAFPQVAMNRGIVDGWAVLECTALATGALRDCVVVEETPQGVGFGMALLVASRRARLSNLAPGYVPDARFRFDANFALR